MAKVPKLKLKIDFKELFGKDVKSDALRQAIAGDVIKTIQNRTQSGVDKNGRTFQKYSKAYKESDDFKIYGKTSKVDLTLTGDMLGLMEITRESSRSMDIGWEDRKQNDKAYGHISGFEGHPTIKGVKPRDFFGISKEEKQKITNKYQSRVDQFSTLEEEKSKSATAFEKTAVNIIRGLLEEE